MESADRSGPSRPLSPVAGQQVAGQREGGGGRTFISDEVVSVISRIAAEQVEGVHQIGESNLRAVLARRGRHAGVASEVGLKEAAIDIEIVVTYGYPIVEVASAIRQQVIENVEHMTGRKVVGVDINVVDVHIPKVESGHKRQLQ